jgi:hypothetical protein
MKKALRFFSLFLVLALGSCNNDDDPVVIPLYIIGEWKHIGYYQDGVYIEGADCHQVKTFTFDDHKTGNAHVEYCNNQFPARDFPLERKKIDEDVHLITFPNNNAPWLMVEGEMTTGTIVEGKMHLETYDRLDANKPDRSSRIDVYEKLVQ